MTASTIYALAFSLGGIRLAHQALLQGPLLGEADYRRRFLLPVALRNGRLAAPIAAVLGVCLWRPAETGWEAIAAGSGALRIVAGVIAAALAWSLSTYSRNLFLGQTHALERVLLLVLGGLVWAHPMAIAPFMGLLIVLVRQFEHPASLLYSQTHLRLPIDLMLAIMLWTVASALFTPEAAALPVLLLTIAACAYWMPGLAKLWMGPYPGAWIFHNRVHRLAVSARQQGWMNRVPMPLFLKAARLLGRVDVGIAALTLGIELIAVAMLYDRTAAAVLLVLFAGLHSVILLSSGINFWKWVVADLALAGLVWTMPESAAQAIFTPEHLALSVVIMATQAVHLKCVELGWLDTRLTSAFRIEVVGASGRSYRLSPGAMAPFDMVFAQHRHYHFCPFKTLTNTYGTLYARGKRGWAKYRAIEAAQGRQPEHEQVRREHGFNHADESRSQEFERFMRRVVPEMARRAGARDWWSYLAAPRHIYVGATSDAWRAQEPAERVRIWFEENWYDGQGVREVNRALVRDIHVGAIEPVVRPLSLPTANPPANSTARAQVA